MQLQDRYDWVVLGDHPAALLSAGLASQLGFSVLILPFAPSHLMMVSPEGQCLDPEPNYILGLSRFGSSTGLLAECLAHLGASSFTPKLVRSGVEITPQVITPQVRLQFELEDDGLFHQLDREFGTELAKTSGFVGALDVAESRALEFWRNFPSLLTETAMTQSQLKWPATLKPRRKFSTPGLLYRTLTSRKDDKYRSSKSLSRDWLKPTIGLDVLKSRMSFLKRLTPLQVESVWGGFSETLEGLWHTVTGSPEKPDSVLDLIHVLSMARTAGSFRGGMSAYRRFLMGLAQRLGAQIPAGVECRRIFVEDGKLMGVQLMDRGKMIAAKAGILGCSTTHLKDFLSFSGKKGKQSVRLGQTPSGWKFTLAISVHAEAIPVGMGARAVWKERGAPPLEIEVVSPEDYDLGSGEIRFIFLRTTLPFTQESLNVNEQRLIASRMFRQLIEIFPFLEFHVTQIYPDFRVPETSSRDEFSEAYGFVSPEYIPDNLRVTAGPGLGPDTGILGLYAANGESYPAMGSFGPTVAAIESVTRFASEAGPAFEEKLRDFWTFLQ